MKIGIVGVGVVGEAVKYGMEKIGHKVTVHDIRLDTSINDVLDSEIVFVCVPTPSTEEGSCDTSIVESVVTELNKLSYTGVISIKSTVSPGTTERLNEEHGGSICFVPEFLRERCATTDFIENHDVCIIGTKEDRIFDIVKKAHGKLPDKFVHVSETEAELCKYFNNIYNATLITFANAFYEVCESLGADYTEVKNAIVNRNHINDIYLDCNDNFRGFGGMCLPKDTKAIAAIAKDKTHNTFFDDIMRLNSTYKTTVFDGMRP